MITRFSYPYHDRANYKQWHEFGQVGLTIEPPTLDFSAAELAQRFAFSAAGGWVKEVERGGNASAVSRPDKTCIACEVVCLVLLNLEGAVLATQRPEGKRLAGLWEFPGGKIEPGELAEEALRREIREELDMELGTLTPMFPVEHQYDFGAIRLIPYLAGCQTPDFSLMEHMDARWLPVDRLDDVTWAPADIPIVNQLRELP